MFFQAVFTFLVVIISSRIERLLGYVVQRSNDDEAYCSTRENFIFNVSPIKINEGRLFCVQIEHKGTINYKALLMSKENCFSSSSKQASQEHASIYCLPGRELSQNHRISRPKDNLRTKMGIQFEYCGNNIQNVCCKDEEFSTRGYKCLVNQFGQLGLYQARYWKSIPATNLSQINKAGSERQMTFDTFKSKVNNGKKDLTVSNNGFNENSLSLFSPSFEMSPFY